MFACDPGACGYRGDARSVQTPILRRIESAGELLPDAYSVKGLECSLEGHLFL